MVDDHHRICEGIAPYPKVLRGMQIPDLKGSRTDVTIGPLVD